MRPGSVPPRSLYEAFPAAEARGLVQGDPGLRESDSKRALANCWSCPQVQRVTRSLADFAKLVELFDQCHRRLEFHTERPFAG
jgi:hypothetical protein